MFLFYAHAAGANNTIAILLVDTYPYTQCASTGTGEKREIAWWCGALLTGCPADEAHRRMVVSASTCNVVMSDAAR